MAIDADLVVELDGGKVSFEAPGLNVWAILLDIDKKPVHEQAEIIIGAVTSTEGLTKKNGESVTLETLKAKDFPLTFFFRLKESWVQAIVTGAKREAASGNE